MQGRTAERLRQLALKCSQLARDHRGQPAAADLEGVAAELAEQASKLDQLFKLLEEI